MFYRMFCIIMLYSLCRYFLSIFRVLPDAPRLSTSELALISQPKVVNVDFIDEVLGKRKKWKQKYDYNSFKINLTAQKRKLQSSVSWANNAAANNDSDESDEPKTKSLKKEEREESSDH